MEGLIRTEIPLDGIEGLNGSTPEDLNLMACDAGSYRSLPLFGGSDAHHIDRVGKYATKFSKRINTVEQLVKAIKEGNTKPVYFDDGEYVEFNYHHLLNTI